MARDTWRGFVVAANRRGRSYGLEVGEPHARQYHLYCQVSTFCASPVVLNVELEADHARQYDGFDITDSFFPKPPHPAFSYSTQNIFKPLPVEYHGKYS